MEHIGIRLVEVRANVGERHARHPKDQAVNNWVQGGGTCVAHLRGLVLCGVYLIVSSVLALAPACGADEYWTLGTDLPRTYDGQVWDYPSAASLDGKIYLFGEGPNLHYRLVRAYDCGTDTWQDMTPMPENRFQPGVATVGDSIYVIGGIGPDGFTKATVWRYTPALELPLTHRPGTESA